jgi:hypothetical protein
MHVPAAIAMFAGLLWGAPVEEDEVVKPPATHSS